MNKIISNKTDEIIQLCKLYNVKSLYVFGSAISEFFHEKSDIDFLISFNNISIDDYTNNYFDLHYKLEDLFKRKIDLLTVNSLSNPYFIKSIDTTKELLYES